MQGNLAYYAYKMKQWEIDIFNAFAKDNEVHNKLVSMI